MDRNKEIRILQLWSTELIDWISETSDVRKLAVTYAILAEGIWPLWLPSKPINFNSDKDSVESFFTMEVYRMILNKAELICPGLTMAMYATGLYGKYCIVDEGENGNTILRSLPLSKPTIAKAFGEVSAAKAILEVRTKWNRKDDIEKAINLMTRAEGILLALNNH